MKPIIYFAAFAAALLTVLGTRVLIPALELAYYSALKSWEPEEPELVPVLAAVPEPTLVVTEEKPVSKPRPARRRKPSAKTLAKAQAALA